MYESDDQCYNIFFLVGASGHNVPILPKGDPNIEKPQPRVHLDAPIVNDEEVRNEIIAEEEAKEQEQVPDAAAIENLVQNNPKNDDNDIHDFANAVLPPSKDQEVVYKKKPNMGIKGNILLFFGGDFFQTGPIGVRKNSEVVRGEVGRIFDFRHL